MSSVKSVLYIWRCTCKLFSQLICTFLTAQTASFYKTLLVIVCLFILWLISYKIEKWHGKFLHTHLPLCPVCYLGTDYIDDLFLCPMSFLGTISVDDLLPLCPVVSRDYLPEKGGGVLKTSWDFKGHSSSCGSNPQCRSNLMYHHCCLQIKHHSLLDSSNRENKENKE